MSKSRREKRGLKSFEEVKDPTERARWKVLQLMQKYLNNTVRYPKWLHHELSDIREDLDEALDVVI